MNWLDTPTTQALAWTILHFLWEGVLVAVILAAALAMARERSQTRYTLAAMAMFAMPLVFVATFAVLLPERPIHLASPVRGAPAVTFPSVPPFLPSPPGSRTLDYLIPWAVPIWMAGVLACYLRSLIGWMAAQRLRRTGVCDPPREWHGRVEQLARRLRVSRPVVLLESALAEVPLTIGFLRPVILMPAGLLAGLPVAQVETILLHELAHIRRRDYLVNLAQSVVEGLLFYHPAVWWISKIIRAERENCCDDVVIEIAGDRHGYAAALTALEEIRYSSREPALAATGGKLMNRIRRILQKPESRGTIGPALYSGILLVVAATVLAAWPIETPEPPPMPPAPQVSVRPPVPPRIDPMSPFRKWMNEDHTYVPSPYSKWMNQDVAYIITDGERSEFRSLATNEERERFIEQFWLRRDPTPTTVENEMKAEHYRRIAYANRRFASSLAGWKTDRGRTYITYGPADEVESHLGGGPGGYPYEVWKYRYIEGLGESVLFGFFDANRDGEYRLIVTNPLTPEVMDTVRELTRPGGNNAASIRIDRQITKSADGSTEFVTHLVNLTLDLDAPATIYGRVVAREGKKTVTMFEARTPGAGRYAKSFSLVSNGSYFVDVVYKTASGRLGSERIPFELNGGPR